MVHNWSRNLPRTIMKGQNKERWIVIYEAPGDIYNIIIIIRFMVVKGLRKIENCLFSS